MKRTHPILTSVAAGFGAAALPYLGYAGMAWICYGTRQAPSHPLLDPFIPRPEVAERHETQIDAPADVVFAVARKLDVEASPVVRAIFRGRELLLGAQHAERDPRPFLERVPELGWGVLAEEPRHIVFGAVAQPWNADVKFLAIPPQEFAAFAEPGFAKIAWTIEAEPMSETASLFRTETRVVTTDEESRRRFRRYWAFLSPGILVIRREILRLVKKGASEASSAA